MYFTHTANTVDRNIFVRKSCGCIVVAEHVCPKLRSTRSCQKPCVICGEEETTQWELDYKCYICRAVDVKISDTQNKTYEDMLITDSTFH